MNSILIFGGGAVVSYLLGAVPNGYLIARAKGIDIRRVGSGNIGATNVFRSVGKSWGIITFVADALKGFVPALVLPAVARRYLGYSGGREMALLCACLAIVGHNWPVYLGFKGGKGVATSAGGLLGIAPAALGIGAAVWLVFFLVSRYVSVASLAVAVLVPVSGWFLYRGEGALLPGVLTLLGIIMIIRHRANIQRLFKGTEHRFSFGSRRKDESPSGSPG